jgi:hypothetical protein
MAEQHATPAPARGLRLLPGDTAAPGSAAPGTDTAGGTVPGPVPPAALVPMSAAGRARVTLKHRARGLGAVARELWFHPDRLAHSVWQGRPESMAEHFAYMRSRAWVPAELDGRKAAFIAWAGLAYHVLIGWPLKCAAKLLDAAAGRPLRLACLIAFLAVFVFLILPRL